MFGLPNGDWSDDFPFMEEKKVTLSYVDGKLKWTYVDDKDNVTKWTAEDTFGVDIKQTIEVLEALIGVLKNAKSINNFEFKGFREVREVPTQDSFNYQPTGVHSLTINIEYEI